MSPWTSILRARSTSEAIETAAAVPTTSLSNAALPVSLENLSERARRNVAAVHRSLGVDVMGFRSDGWEAWEDGIEEHAKGARGRANTNMDETVSLERNIAMADAVPDIEQRTAIPVHREKTLSSDDKEIPAHNEQVESLRKKTANSEDPASVANVRNETLVQNHDNTVKTPSAAEVKCAEELKQWALSAPHKPPPEDLIEKINHSTSVPAMLQIMTPDIGRTDSLAAIISAFTGKIGSGFATHVIKILLIPYAEDLETPAPRDIMQAVVAFSEHHWRAIVCLYEHFAAQGSPVNGAVAEILVRVTSAIATEGAVDGLRSFCNCKWGEDGIRVIEALLSKCKSEPGIAGLIVPALDRNVVGCEKSVRFGKLLFSAARDLPGAATNHKEAMESICSRSKVFLGKRALALIKSKGPEL